MEAKFNKYILKFKRPAGTSRGTLLEKETYFLTLKDKDKKGVGECAIFRGLSYDDTPFYEKRLTWLCENIHLGKEKLFIELQEFPSIKFGLEQALMDLRAKDHILFDSTFSRGEKGIPINGLIWMGDLAFVKSQIEEKLAQGFKCLKLKIGVNWEVEHKVLLDIRKNYSPDLLEIRVDANGAFSYLEAIEVLKDLAKLNVHSIEQPLKPSQLNEMAKLCESNYLPIALDEQLIGVFGENNKTELLQRIKPDYIILKPSLVGGFKETEEWIKIAENWKIKWWITSALESNIGLNAIAQFTSVLQNRMVQGLGTGSLFTNNISSPLIVKKDQIWYDTKQNWNIDLV